MSLWQTKSWQDMLMKSGQTQEYFIIEQNFQSPESGLKTKIFVEKRKVSLGEYGLFVIGFEGIPDENVWDNLQELCAEENCLFAQMETINYCSSLSYEEREQTVALLSFKGEEIQRGGDNYYKKFIPPYTALIDLTQNQEEILAAMKPKGRYNIRLAQKNGVQGKLVEKSRENIKIFYDLMRETTSRDHFSGNTLAFYQTFLEQENAFLFFAEHEGEILAAGIFVQEAAVFLYYYGASSNHKRNLMAPYVLQWTALLYAKEHHAKIYDFLGIATPGEENSPLAGVTDFKLKFTQDIRNVSKSFLYIHKKWKYCLIQFLKKMKK